MRNIVFGMISILSAGSVAMAQDLAHGEHIAKTKCAACHAVDSKESAPGQPSKAPPFSSVAHRPEITREFLDSFLSRHHRGMPNFYLTYTEISDVSAYILSLRE